MIVLIGGEKGGAGKSTIACNLAVFLSQQGKNIILLDADPQKTASSWAHRRSLLKNTNHTPMPCLEKTGDIYDTLLELRKKYDFVIVDTGGRDSKELRSGLIAADILCTPVKPSQIDIDTLAKMNELVEQAKSLNRKLKAYTIITHAPTNPNMDDKKETEEVLNTLSEFIRKEMSLSYRSSYWRTMGKGLSVLEYTDEKAKAEILTLGISFFPIIR